MAMVFDDRTDAGRKLAERLGEYRNKQDVLVLGLPRGGVPVAYEVAEHLGAPLDVFLVRKLGAPGNEEFALGAIATGGVRVINNYALRQMGVSTEALAAVAAREQRELERRESLYRGDEAEPDIAGKVVILVDDGLATGATMRAAVLAVKVKKPQKVVVAVPTGSAEACHILNAEADEVLCLDVPTHFGGVGAWYRDFAQTSDEEVLDLLNRARQRMAA
ncbi:phosphoribosyltransferase [Desulfocurvibacter africanus]|uniref:Phosphoribosyltransferase n=2 Tax=Desulfocurvibacter africanus TaxID=873 RepID=F3YX02_DESAF|nr:phosphoribosyltransferase family protein [Desulfocurvibacter africanus]EGJ49390.1 phosphoribosyltransferase [Desulfocurvibacter africanus subsp. africanus str. Walvis Bay]